MAMPIRIIGDDTAFVEPSSGESTFGDSDGEPFCAE